jgi:hypothetical protein
VMIRNYKYDYQSDEEKKGANSIDNKYIIGSS